VTVPSWTRRELGRLAAGASFAGLPMPALGQARARVAVVGGGAGGATVAKYLARSGAPIDVTLVEANPHYTTCFFSNLCLAGLRSFDTLVHGYDALADRYRINVLHDRAVAIDPDIGAVRLAGGDSIAYDRLVVSPGIDFRYDAIEGYDEAATETIPHAWRGGEQARLLRRQLETMRDGGTFVLVAPPDPFRCPPGPYERASLIADYFRREKPKSKILILDGKNKFSKQELFFEAWDRHYPGMIEWLPSDFTGGVTAVVPADRAIVTTYESFAADVANIIPPQTAGHIALEAGLADESGWCPVDPATLESRLQAGIHVVGDAIVPGDMPKSAFAANSQAKTCAMAVAAALTGTERFAPHLFNTCWSFVTANEAIKIGASYRISDGKITAAEKFISKVGESTETRIRTAHQAEDWYAACTTDMFG
jgi:NADPH-dependent 2,4-dienoyl-CoA reductase/sulfur reductase-like enzyme